jgi:hypothetical protein
MSTAARDRSGPGNLVAWGLAAARVHEVRRRSPLPGAMRPLLQHQLQARTTPEPDQEQEKPGCCLCPEAAQGSQDSHAPSLAPGESWGKLRKRAACSHPRSFAGNHVLDLFARRGSIGYCMVPAAAMLEQMQPRQEGAMFRRLPLTRDEFARMAANVAPYLR